MIMHILFEIYIKEDSGIYGFVLVENILVTFLFLVHFLAISFYFWTVAIGAVEGYFYFHKTKIRLETLIAYILLQHTF
jgi:hypothetical protein